MANNAKTLFNTQGDSGRTAVPDPTRVAQGWYAPIGTQKPRNSEMNFMMRQAMLSNDFWHEVEVNLSTSGYMISEATTDIGTASSYPAESLLFNITARAVASPLTNPVTVATASAFTDWPVGRAFWVRNSVPDKAAFVKLPDIAANSPSIPSAITDIYKILMPGQYVKFRVIGSGTSRLPYLALEYDSHWVGTQPNLTIGATMDDTGTFPLTKNTINEYYNGHSYCGMAQIVGTINAAATGSGTATAIPMANYTVNVIGSYNMPKDSVFPIYQNYNEQSNGGGANPYIPDMTIGRGATMNPNPIFPNLYQGYPAFPGSSAADLDLPVGAFYAINLGTTDPNGVPARGDVKMRFPVPQGFITTAPTDDAATNIFQKPRVVQSTRSISCLNGVNVGSNVIRPMTTAWQSGGCIVGYSTRDSDFHNTVVARVYASETGNSTYTPFGQFLDTIYVIYPNPAAGNAMTPGYF